MKEKFCSSLHEGKSWH